MKINGPPKGEAWIWLTRDLLASDAWRTMSGRARKVIDFLMLEHMAKGGRHNGKLKAPYRQLEECGITPRLVRTSIAEAEELGLIECGRGGMRVATTYGLTWLPLHDGTPAGNQWRGYRNLELQPMTQAKTRNLPPQGKAALPTKGKADGANLPPQRKADTPQNLPPQGKALLRNSYQGGQDISDLSVTARAAGPAPAKPSSPDGLDLPVCLDRRHLAVVGNR